MTEEEFQPDVDELLQQDPFPRAIPVKHDGPILTHALPSRLSTVSARGLTTTPQQVAWPDLKRRRLTLIADAAWVVSHSAVGGTGGPWPANVPLVVEHASPVYASTATGTANMTIIPEVWAD